MIIEDDVLLEVCSFYKIKNPADVFASNRKAETVKLRNTFWSLCRKFTVSGYRKLGEYGKNRFGSKAWDHATVLHAVNAVEDIIPYDRKYRESYEIIENSLKKIQAKKLSEFDSDNYDLDSEIAIAKLKTEKKILEKRLAQVNKRLRALKK